MRHRFIFIGIFVATLALPAAAHPPFSQVAELADPTFGDVHLYAPVSAPKSVIILLSDSNGFGNEERLLAHGLRQRGNLVVGLDWSQARRQVAGREAMTCEDFAERVENLALRVERQRGITPYLTPVIAGVGLTGAAAQALAPQTASHKIAGVVALRAPAMLSDQGAFCLAPAAAPLAPPALREVQEDDDSAAGEAAEALAAAGGPHGPADLADLPLTVMAARRPPTRMAVLLTGDGGVGPFDRRLADALVGRGVTVAILDSRRYFWAQRDPDAVAADLRRIIKHFRATTPVERVALVGYSFGADYLPLAWNRLPANTRRVVAVVSLLGLAPATDLRVELSDDLYANATPLLPAVAQIDAPQVQCLYGKDDLPAAQACPAAAIARPDFDVRSTEGGHNFNFDVARLADIIVAPLMAAAPVPHHVRHP